MERIAEGIVINKNPKDMTLCINVIAANRPNYLYVCLESIFKNTIVPDVYVYIDMLADGSVMSKENLEVIAYFPVRGVFINDKHRSVGGQFWYSFENSFRFGYDYGLYMEDDWLITSDAIKWLYECPKICSIYTVHRWTSAFGIDPDPNSPYTILRNGEYLSWCVAFSKEIFEFLHKIVKSRSYTGFWDLNVVPNFINQIEGYDWDILLIAIAKFYKLTQLVPPVSLLAHFGNKSCHQGFGYGAHAVNRDSDMFVGEKNTWLDNITKMFETLTMQEIHELAWAPGDFRYR